MTTPNASVSCDAILKSLYTTAVAWMQIQHATPEMLRDRHHVLINLRNFAAGLIYDSQKVLGYESCEQLAHAELKRAGFVELY